MCDCVCDCVYAMVGASLANLTLIKLWTLGDGVSTPVVAASAAPGVTLAGHTKAVRSLAFHPTAAHVLCSTGLDLTVRVWDVEHAQERIVLRDKLDEPVLNAAWNLDGQLLATASRDRVVRVFDVRSKRLAAVGCGPPGAMGQLVAWCDHPVADGPTTTTSCHLLSVGFSSRNERQLSVWDVRHMLDPLVTTTMCVAVAAVVVVVVWMT